MRKEDIIRYFDSCAATWDSELIKSDHKINVILNHAAVCSGCDVLDVACGTGVLISYYLERQVNSVTAIDISSKMIEIAQEKFAHTHVNFVCGDVETATFDRKFDCIVVYNAFPHFPNPKRLIHHLVSLLNPGGVLTIAHGMSRAQIDKCHTGAAAQISCGLMHEDNLRKLLSEELDVTVKISNDDIYQLCGRLLET